MAQANLGLTTTAAWGLGRSFGASCTPASHQDPGLWASILGTRTVEGSQPLTPDCTSQLLGEGKQEKPCACPKRAVSDGEGSPGKSGVHSRVYDRGMVWAIQSEKEGKSEGRGYKV